MRLPWINAIEDVCADEGWNLIERWDAKKFTTTIHGGTLKIDKAFIAQAFKLSTGGTYIPMRTYNSSAKFKAFAGCRHKNVYLCSDCQHEGMRKKLNFMHVAVWMNNKGGDVSRA